MLARPFLYVIAAIIALLLAAGVVWTLYQAPLLRLAFVPDSAFSATAAGPAPDYARPDAWLSRPGLPDDPSRRIPHGFDAPAKLAPAGVAIFYVPPTTYYDKARWNGPVADPASREWLTIFAASEASAFNGLGAIWAPRYRQAALGAFLTDKPEAKKAIDLAYGDVLRAFDAFIARVPASQPIIIAGHSQGSLHLIRLMRDRVAGKPVAKRIAAAYLIGWPISIEADIPAMGLPACAAAGQPNCIISWQSFADPAEPDQIRQIFEASPGLTGRPRKGTHMLCVNPLTGAQGTGAAATANRGTLVPSADFRRADLTPGLIPARCDPSGLLLIGLPPKGFDRFVMPGNNYHVFDYALFWANLRADAGARTTGFVTP